MIRKIEEITVFEVCECFKVTDMYFSDCNEIKVMNPYKCWNV